MDEARRHPVVAPFSYGAAMAKLRLGAPLIQRGSFAAAKRPPKTVDSHYNTPEHGEWRRKVIERAGHRCQAPGCTVAAPSRLYADHIVELRDGGAALDVDNGQALCASHHSAKTIAARTARLRG